MADYRVETRRYARPALRVPVAFLITMHDSPRRAAYLAQLDVARPTAIVHILHNPGRAHKRGVDSTRHDIWHANQEIFRRARDLACPILVIEDDVEFDARALRDAAPRIEDALAHAEAYFLGCIPLLSRAIDSYHAELVLGGCAHAVVYTPAARRRLEALALPKRLTHDLLVTSACRSWTSRRPLATQTHAYTANAAEWGRYCFWYFRLMGAERDGSRFYAHHHALLSVGGVLGLTAQLVGIVSLVLLAERLRASRPSLTCGA